jgi:integrase
VRRSKQKGLIVLIGKRWFVRYWESRNVNGVIVRKRVSHPLGPVTTRGKTPPADIVDDADRHMASVNSRVIPADRIVTIGDFVDNVYLPWVKDNKRPSTAKGYREIWEDHLQPQCARVLLKNVKTFNVQNWLNEIGKKRLSRNTLKHVKSVVSAIFTLAKQLGFFEGANPAQGTATNPAAPAPMVTHAYNIDEIRKLLAVLPEPAATAFAVAAFAGLRHGEIQGLQWDDYKGGALYVTRSIWNGRISAPKTRTSEAPVPVIRQLAERLEIHRLRDKNPESGPIFPNVLGKPMALTSLVNRQILPALNRCERCGKSELAHSRADHKFKRDERLPRWHGWHAARRGLGSNLHRLGVSPKVIQAILRHANVNTTATYYIKTADEDVRAAMATLEENIANTATIAASEGPTIKNSGVGPLTIQ